MTRPNPKSSSAKPGADKGSKGGGAESTGETTVVLPPMTRQMSVLKREGPPPAEKTGFARQHERETHTETKATGKSGTWSSANKGGEVADNPGAAYGSIPDVLVEPAEGEEKGKDFSASGKEFFESWAGGEKESEEKETGEKESGETETGGGGSTSETGSGDHKGDADTGSHEGFEGEAKSGSGGTESGTESHGKESEGENGLNSETHTSEVGGFTETTEVHTQEVHGKGAAVGDFAADPEIRKALEVLKFADERREGHGGKTYQAGAGTKGSAETSVTTRKGATRQTAIAQAEGLAGVQATAKTLAVADEKELTAAITALAQAGAFGEAGMSYDVKKGRAALKAYAEASGGAGLQARGRAVAHVDKSPLMPTVVLFFEGAVRAGVWGDVSAGLEGSYGKVIAQAKITASGFAGASAEAKGAVFANAIEGIGVSLQGAAKAGAEGDVVANQSIGYEGLGELEIEEGVMGFAGAQAKAKGKASVSLTGVTLSGQASAFAGAKSSAWVSVAGKLRGREVVKVGGTVGVSVGAGVAVGGTFSFQHGKLTFGGDLAAALKVGGDVGGKFEIDIAALATAILELIADQFNKAELKIDQKSPDFQRDDVADEDQAEAMEESAYKAVIDLFDDHAVKVMDKVHKNKLSGTQCLAVDDLQKIIQKAAIAGGLRSTYKEHDRGIQRAAADAFGIIHDGGDDKSKAVQGLLRSPLVVDGLVVRSLNSASPQEARGQAEQYADAAAAKKAKKSLEKDLKAYNAKKMRDKATRVHQNTVQEIVDKHWKEMSEAFPGGQASQATVDVVTDSLGTLLGDGTTPIQISGSGKITQFPHVGDLVFGRDDSRHHAAEAAEENKLSAVHDVLKSNLAGYKTKLIASADKKTKEDSVNKIIKESTSGIKSELKGPNADAVRQGVQDVVRQELGPLITDVTFGEGITVSGIAWDAQALSDARDGKTADVQAAKRQAALNKLAAKVSSTVGKGAKKSKGTGPESEEVKQAAIAKIRSELPKAYRTLTYIDGIGDTEIKGIDTALTEVINESLGGLFTVTVVKGVLDPSRVSQGTDAAVFAEQHRQEHATLKGGQEQDNARRRIIADALRKPFGSYSAEVRTAVSETASGSTKVKITAVEKARMQEIIDKGLKGVRADVKNDVGDEALTDAAVGHFGIKDDGRSGPGVALLKKFRSQGLKIAEFEAVPVAEAAKRAKTSVAAEKKAQDTLERALRKDVKDMPGYTPTATILNYTIRESGVADVSNIDLDTVIRLAVGAVWSGELEAFDVADGAVTEFRFRRIEVTARGGGQ